MTTGVEEAAKKVERLGRFALLQMQVAGLVARPRLAMVAEAIGREAWGSWRAHGREGMLVCVDAARAALDVLDSWEMPATQDGVPAKPRTPMLVRLLGLDPARPPRRPSSYQR